MPTKLSSGDEQTVGQWLQNQKQTALLPVANEEATDLSARHVRNNREETAMTVDDDNDGSVEEEAARDLSQHHSNVREPCKNSALDLHHSTSCCDDKKPNDHAAPTATVKRASNIQVVSDNCPDGPSSTSRAPVDKCHTGCGSFVGGECPHLHKLRELRRNVYRMLSVFTPYLDVAGAGIADIEADAVDDFLHEVIYSSKLDS
jgi:hypothetical protein